MRREELVASVAVGIRGMINVMIVLLCGQVIGWITNAILFIYLLFLTSSLVGGDLWWFSSVLMVCIKRLREWHFFFFFLFLWTSVHNDVLHLVMRVTKMTRESIYFLVYYSCIEIFHNNVTWLWFNDVFSKISFWYGRKSWMIGQLFELQEVRSHNLSSVHPLSIYSIQLFFKISVLFINN